MSDDLLNDLLGFGGDEIVDNKRSHYDKSPIPMPGGKWRCLKEIIPKLPITASSTWVDHCGGSGIVSLNVPDCKLMVFNDRNSAIVDFYRCVRDRRKELVDYVEQFHPSSREEFYHAKTVWCTETDPVKRAAFWFYMMRTSFAGKGHVFGRQKVVQAYPVPESLKLFEHVQAKFKQFTLENLDMRLCARDYDSAKTVHYFDPPYVDTDQGMYAHKWKWDDMQELLTQISHLRGFVALSHYPDERIDRALKWTRRYEWQVHVTADAQVFHEDNNKAGMEGRKAGSATECLWIKDFS